MKLFQSQSITSLRACGLAGLRACAAATSDCAQRLGANLPIF
jgi:hypothetical protein